MIFFTFLCFSIVHCNFEDKNSKLRQWLKARADKIPDIKANLEKAIQDDLILKSLFGSGYESFTKTATISTQNKLEDVNREAIILEKWMNSLNLDTMLSEQKIFVKNSFPNFGFLNTIYSFTTIGPSKRTKMYVILSQKEGLWDKVGDYLMINFQPDTELPDTYQQSYRVSSMDWCPAFDYVCKGNSAQGNTKLTYIQRNWRYNFIGVITYEYLNTVYRPIK